MNTNDAVREIMKSKAITVTALAFAMNKSQRLVSERLGQENISIKKLNEMLRIMGYKIVLIPRESKCPEDGFEVE